MTVSTPKAKGLLSKHKILADTSNSSKTTLSQSNNASHQELNAQEFILKKKLEPFQQRESRFRAETQPSEKSTPRGMSNSREDGRASRNRSEGAKIDSRFLDEGEQTQISFLQSKCLVPQTMDALNRSNLFKKVNPFVEKKVLFLSKAPNHPGEIKRKPFQPKRVVLDPTIHENKQKQNNKQGQFFGNVIDYLLITNFLIKFQPKLRLPKENPAQILLTTRKPLK